MNFVRDLWLDSFPENETPALPCPRCDHGRLRYAPNTLQVMESEAARLAQRIEGLTPLEIRYLFSLFFECSINKCGCFVSVHGNAELKERDYYDLDEDQFFYMLHPRGMFPAPPLVSIPSEAPDDIIKEIRIAFHLFWVDLGSCANRLRISVEKTLDHLERPSKNNLSKRIKDFQERDPDHADTFNALRHVGNLGSHEGAVERDAVLDAFEIFQDALAELFGKRSDKISEIRKRLIQSEGRY